MSHKKTKDRTSGAILAVSLLFYLFFAVYDGAVICVDSPSYIYMDISREPFYPLFLALLRTIFAGRGDFYLTAAAFLQSLLAALAAWSLADFLRKEFRLSALTGFLLLAAPLATSLLCRFAAQRGSMYSNSILTEGIACSLYLIFIRYILDYCWHQEKKSLLFACVITFVLISTRKQMYVSLFLLVAAMLFTSIKTGKGVRGLLAVLLCPAVILAGNILFDCSYNYVLRGAFVTHSSDNRFLATMVFYTAEREDAEVIRDPALKELFGQIYDICDENGYVKHSAGEGWLERVSHFGDNYDCIQIDTMWPMLQEYVYENCEGDSAVLEEQVDALTREIIAELLPQVWLEIMAVFLDNCLSGLVTTVAQRTPVLVVCSALLYAVYVVLLVLNMKKEGLGRICILGIFTLLSIFVNVAVVSAVIFCQTRYTIYNMPLFYISGALLFVNALPKNIREKFFVSAS